MVDVFVWVLRLSHSVDFGIVLSFDVHPIGSVTEDNINRASHVDEDSPNFQILYDKIYDEWIAVR